MYKERIESCGQRIAKALDINGMKQAELCKLAKVPKSSLSLYLSGAYEPKQNRIYDMARVLNVSEAWLMGYDVPMERDKKVSPDKVELTEGEKKWLELYNKVSDETKAVLINMLDSFDRLPADSQRMALEMIRVALKNQKQ
jgi:transcriptional regulator with XRE-family HTH domain